MVEDTVSTKGSPALDANCNTLEPVKTARDEIDGLSDFDDLLPHIGEFGLYQKLLFLMMIPFTFSVAFVYFTQIFLTLVPEEHWCMVPELQHLPLSQRLVNCIKDSSPDQTESNPSSRPTLVRFEPHSSYRPQYPHSPTGRKIQILSLQT
ncbi:hypothetical protein AAG570_004075 [Ranatra chinensis]|uniref:Carcinine transporter-like n=1 Tax=Ranatra chinensis TaxID=642074 RepID=A0ABD0Y508_9HEMI